VQLRTFVRQAVAPALPGLLAAAAVAAVLERWSPPVTLGEIFAQCLAAGAAFVALFVPFGLRGYFRLRSRTGSSPTQEVPVQ
jgi:phage baseplate assembly protein W